MNPLDFRQRLRVPGRFLGGPGQVDASRCSSTFDPDFTLLLGGYSVAASARAGVLARRFCRDGRHPKRGLGLMEQGASFRRPGTATHFFGPTFIGSFSAFAASLRAA